jgi:hypothetical protein
MVDGDSTAPAEDANTEARPGKARAAELIGSLVKDNP